jgi:hypothetical protein
MWHAGTPPLPLPLAIKRVPGWGGAWKAAVTSALALRQQFTVRGDVLERVQVYKYLGQMMAHDDNNTKALRAQLWKARATWA